MDIAQGLGPSERVALYRVHGNTLGEVSDITSDLVFPVMFGVADDKTAARIIARLSDNDFWTEAGIRTAPRNSPSYSPDQGWGLLGGCGSACPSGMPSPRPGMRRTS